MAVLRNKWFRTLLAACTSVVLSWILLSRYSLDGLCDALSGVKWDWILLGVFCRVVVALLQGVRWRILFPEYSFVLAVHGCIIAEGANALIPARGGELVRAFYFKLMKAQPLTENITAAFIERGLDALALGCFVVASGMLLNFKEKLRYMVVLSGCSLVFVFILMVFLIRHKKKVLELIEKRGNSLLIFITVRLSVVSRKSLKYIDSIRRKCFITASLVSLIIVIMWGATLWSLLNAVSLPVAIGDSLLIFPLIALGVAIPVSVGYVGVFHGVLLGALTLIGFDAAKTLPLVVVVHLLLFCPAWIYCMLLLGWHMSNVSKI